jgi:hypothetical protein
MVVFKTGRSPVKLSNRSRAGGLWSDRQLKLAADI